MLLNATSKNFAPTNSITLIWILVGWTLNNHLNNELFRSNNLHGYEKLPQLFIGKIEFLQITLRR